MKLSLLSDLHFEFHKDGGINFINSLDNSDIDVLLLAGDIGTLPVLENAIKQFCDKYPQVVHIAGNHEFWGSTRNEVIDHLTALDDKIDNYHFLDNSIYEYNGQRFLGTTLWFREAPKHLRRDWSDCYHIKDFSNWIGKQNDKSIDFLASNMQKGDVVITHHLPSEKSVAAQFANSPTNCFFVCDVEDLIENQQPALVCHGHTHCSASYYIGDTKVLCNPFGYVGYELNQEFNDKLIIDI